MTRKLLEMDGDEFAISWTAQTEDAINDKVRWNGANGLNQMLSFSTAMKIYNSLLSEKMIEKSEMSQGMKVKQKNNLGMQMQDQQIRIK
jgi:hypothetical protein